MKTIFIILIAIALIFLVIWLWGNSMAKTLRKIENESEDAYWILDKTQKYIDDLEEEKDEEGFWLDECH